MTRPVRQADAASETVLKIAVLLHAGVSPAQAWRHLAEAGDAVAVGVAAEVGRGIPVADALPDSSAWAGVAAAWRVASTVGAPLADTLRSLAAALRDAQEAADEVRVALAEPAGTARLMGWLPLVAVALGALLGFDTLTVLFGSPIGIACLGAGGALIVAAQRWSAALVRRAAPESAIPGLGAELFAIAMSGGVSLDRAAAVVREATGAGADAATGAVLSLARTAGVPAAELLRASAALARHRSRVDGRLRAARLSSRLLLPLGVCTLPAFLLLGVAPMLLSVMSTMPVSF